MRATLDVGGSNCLRQRVCCNNILELSTAENCNVATLAAGFWVDDALFSFEGEGNGPWNVSALLGGETGAKQEKRADKLF